MECYGLKYKKKRLYTVLGGGWSFMGVFSLVFFIIFMKSRPEFHIGSIIFGFELILMISLSSILGIYYLKLKSRSYIKITNNGLKVHKGLVWGSNYINFSEIQEIRIQRNKMFLLLIKSNSKREIEIHLDLLYRMDYDILIEELSKHHMVIKGI